MKISRKAIKSISLALTVSALTISGASLAAKPAKLAICMACHGANGIGTQDIYPNIAGQKKAYLISSLKAYRDGGDRQNVLMKGMTASLTDQDIEELATYYSGLK